MPTRTEALNDLLAETRRDLNRAERDVERAATRLRRDMERVLVDLAAGFRVDTTNGQTVQDLDAAVLRRRMLAEQVAQLEWVANAEAD